MLTLKKILTIAALLLCLPAMAPAQVLPHKVAREALQKQAIENECKERANFSWAIAYARASGVTQAKAEMQIRQRMYGADNKIQLWAQSRAVAIYTDPVLINLPPEAIRNSAYDSCMAYFRKGAK